MKTPAERQKESRRRKKDRNLQAVVIWVPAPVMQAVQPRRAPRRGSQFQRLQNIARKWGEMKAILRQPKESMDTGLFAKDIREAMGGFDQLKSAVDRMKMEVRSLLIKQRNLLDEYERLGREAIAGLRARLGEIKLIDYLDEKFERMSKKVRPVLAALLALVGDDQRTQF